MLREAAFSCMLMFFFFARLHIDFLMHLGRKIVIATIRVCANVMREKFTFFLPFSIVLQRGNRKGKKG